MARRRLFWQLYPSYLLIALGILIAVGFYALEPLQTFYRESVERNLRKHLTFLQHHLQPRFPQLTPAELDALCKTLGKKTDIRVTIIAPGGEVFGDTDTDPARMDNHADRPEVLQARRAGVGSITRTSATVGKTLLYMAVPLRAGDADYGTLRMSVPVTDIENALRGFRTDMFLASVVIALIAAAIGWVISRRLSRPMEKMTRGAQRFALGDLDYRLPIPRSAEAAQLSEALNAMATQLKDRIQSVEDQRRRQEALLTSMAEAVVAVDSDESILLLNRAAARLFGVDAKNAQGKPLQLVIRNDSLQRIVTRALDGEFTELDEVVVPGRPYKFLQAHAEPLRSTFGSNIGTLVVMNDVSKLRRLEGIRKDFVANVSHELKTPITSIKGFVETLRDGAFEDEESREKFLGIVSKEADRLTSIIEDLLSLSRVEEDTDHGRIAVERCSLSQLLHSAIRACEPKAAERSAHIRFECDDNISLDANSRLLEQAVINLVDNAIKYSDEGSELIVWGEENESGVSIKVTDRGPGIDAEHQARLFERFYRVDKARSRQMGGTGLGLAIVKHIAQAHGGDVSIDSKVGYGSTFTIKIPLR